MAMTVSVISGPSNKMVPSHIRIVSTQEWCRMNFPSFTDKDHWPPNSPDLNTRFGMSLLNKLTGPNLNRERDPGQ